MSLSPRGHLLTLALVAVLTALTLVCTASGQFYDANYYASTEATALLAGDHPYRDFFEVGIPLDAYLSAAALWAAGTRLIGEFLRQWLFLIAGVVLSFHLALRRTRSVAAALAALPVMLLVLTITPIYHFSKLFFFPLTILLGSRYIERPGPWRGAALALTTALAFLVRHDYGVYLGGGSILAFVIARAAVPASRGRRPMLGDAGAYAAVILVVLAPWLVVVQTHEGLVGYTRARSQLLQGPQESVYPALLRVNPFRQFGPDPLPPPRPGRVVFTWNPEVDDGARRSLERELGLRALDGGTATESRTYDLPNVYDVGLLRLNPLVHDTEGFPWDRLLQHQSRLPGREHAMEWLLQMTLLLPLALLVSGAADWWRARGAVGTAPSHVWPQVFAALFLAGVGSALLRERSYLVVVAPSTAALVAWFLAGAGWLRRGIAVVLLGLSTIAALALAQGSALASPATVIASTQESFARLVRLPPVYGYAPFEYIRECTRDGDRVLIAGLTPLHVSYYTGRPMAGGQINWHRGWRSDPAGEQEALALLQRQSVPFAISTSDPLLSEFRPYPRLRGLLTQRYAVLDGSNGMLMVDRGRTPVRPWGPHGWPCFQ